MGTANSVSHAEHNLGLLSQAGRGSAEIEERKQNEPRISKN